MITSGTASLAKVCLAVAVTIPSPTVSQLQTQLPVSKNALTATSVAIDGASDSTTRETTQQEKLIGEIRGWRLLEDDWDGEGGSKPVALSMKEAVSFVTLLSSEIIPPEPMLLSSGHTALFWNEDGIYADLEFLGDGRITYFIKKNEDKHKGVLEFDSKQMPAVLTTLLRC